METHGACVVNSFVDETTAPFVNPTLRTLLFERTVRLSPAEVETDRFVMR